MDFPAEHRGLIDPDHPLDWDVAHARGAAIEVCGGCCHSTDMLWLMDGCVTDLSSYGALGYTQIILILSLA